jgi:hypothetical protein
LSFAGRGAAIGERLVAIGAGVGVGGDASVIRTTGTAKTNWRSTYKRTLFFSHASSNAAPFRPSLYFTTRTAYRGA